LVRPSLAKHVPSTERNIPNRFDGEHPAIERHRAIVRIDLDRQNGTVPGERVASNRAGVLDGDEAAPASDPTLDPPSSAAFDTNVVESAGGAAPSTPQCGP
jgi:hypothetical protein